MAQRKGFTHEDNEKDHWLTPPDLLAHLGKFDLDPCAYHHQPWRTAATQYALPDSDGLLLPWKGRVWCNPPYGNETVKWVRRLALHGSGYFLVYARTETLAFQEIWKWADALYFFFQRIKFFNGNGSPSGGGTAPSVLAVFGKENILPVLGGGIPKYPGALMMEWSCANRKGTS